MNKLKLVRGADYSDWDNFINALKENFNDHEFLDSIRSIEINDKQIIISGSEEDYIKFGFFKERLQEVLSGLGFTGKITWRY